MSRLRLPSKRKTVPFSPDEKPLTTSTLWTILVSDLLGLICLGFLYQTSPFCTDPNRFPHHDGTEPLPSLPRDPRHPLEPGRITVEEEGDRKQGPTASRHT